MEREHWQMAEVEQFEYKSKVEPGVHRYRVTWL